MTVRAEYHRPAFCLHFAHILVNYGKVRRHVISAVLLCGSKPEKMIVAVYGSAYRTQRIVAVGKRIGQRKFFQARSFGGLDYSDISYIVRYESVKRKFKVAFTALVVRFDNIISKRSAYGFLFLFLNHKRDVFFYKSSFGIIHPALNKFNHNSFPFVGIIYIVNHNTIFFNYFFVAFYADSKYN